MSAAAGPGARGELARVVGLAGAVWLGLGSILGTGVFVSLGFAAEVAGPAVVLAVVLAALVAAANGLASAQLAAAHPVSGGTYEYAHRLVHPLAGYAAGWLFLCAKGASAATAALGCAGYLLHVTGAPTGGGARVVVALGLVVAITGLVAGGVRRSSVVNAVIVALTLVALTTFVGCGAGEVSPARIGEVIGAVGEASPRAVLEATALVFVAYTGYGRIATLGEEVRAPATTIPRAVVLTLGLTMAIYTAVAIVAVATVGAQGFAAATRQAAAPLEVVARAFARPEAAIVVALGAVTAMAGVLLNLVLGLSRVLLAMARRGELPGGLSRVDGRTQSPRRAVLAVGAGIGALTLVGDLRLTWSFSAFTVLLYYGLTNVAALRLPAAARRLPRWVAGFGLLACAGLAWFVEAAAWGSGVALLIVGFAVRGLVRRFTGARSG